VRQSTLCPRQPARLTLLTRQLYSWAELFVIPSNFRRVCLGWGFYLSTPSLAQLVLQRKVHSAIFCSDDGCQCDPVLFHNRKQGLSQRYAVPLIGSYCQIFTTVRPKSTFHCFSHLSGYQMGFSSTRILLFQSINSVIALIGEACCILWVDRTGRRRPLVVGNVMSGLSFVVGSICMARWPGTVDK